MVGSVLCYTTGGRFGLMLDYRWSVRSYAILSGTGSVLFIIPGCRFCLMLDYWWPVQLYCYTVSHSAVVGEGGPVCQL